MTVPEIRPCLLTFALTTCLLQMLGGQVLAGAVDDWWGSKQRLRDSRGISFGASYNVLGQYLDSGRQFDRSGGGVFQAFFSWTPVGGEDVDSGAFVFLLENQHALGDRPAPEAAGLLAGSVLPTASFASFGWHLNNLYWSQALFQRRLIVDVGIVDTLDYVDLSPFNDPLTEFSNYAFAGTPTIPLPDPGPGVIVRLADRGAYVSLGVADASVRAGSFDPGGYFSDRALFSYLELGVEPEFAGWPIERAQLTVWRQTSRDLERAPEDRGIALTLATRLGERFVPFARAAWSKGPSTLTDRALTLGLGMERRQRDLLGIGLNLSRSVAGREQTTLEVFYRLALGPALMLTPHVQLIADPALDADVERLLVLGLRARVAF